MGTMKKMGVVALGLAGCLAVAQFVAPPAFTTPASAKDAPAVAVDAKVYPVNYRIGDLALYTKDGSFNPVVMIHFIENSIAPETWEARGGPSTMAPYPQNNSLVISTTSANHDALAEALSKLRRINN